MKKNIEYVTDYHSFDITKIGESFRRLNEAKKRLKLANSEIEHLHKSVCSSIIKSEFENEKMYKVRYEDEKKKFWQHIWRDQSWKIKKYEDDIKTNEDSLKLSNDLYSFIIVFFVKSFKLSVIKFPSLSIVG